jgi:hypothetical protein
MVQLVRHPQTKERDTDRLHLNHRATSRLYPFVTTQKSRDAALQEAACVCPRTVRSLKLIRANEFLFN